MRLVLSVLALAASAAHAMTLNYEAVFPLWQSAHGKTYATAEEAALRAAVFRLNAEMISAHNAKNLGWTMSLNEFADLTAEEFAARYIGGYRGVPRRQNPVALEHLHTSVGDLPTSVDWTSAGKVTPVKNQASCGSCWAFSATGAVEGAWSMNHTMVSLSEQQLVDCSGSFGNQGCNGGLMDYAFQYIIANKGICSEDAYPYTAKDGKCQVASCKPVVTISSFKDVPQFSEQALLSAIAQQPVAVAIQADQASFQFYSGGVMTQKCGTNLNHGVLATGYGTLSGVDYYAVKNSWGTSWGDKGYILLARGSNFNGKNGQCGIQMDPSYPIV